MIIDALISAFNSVISAFGMLLNLLVGMLPRSPFKNEALQNMNLIVKEHMSTFNWFVPVDAILGVTVYWLIAISTYYLISVAMRWAKMIE